MTLSPKPLRALAAFLLGAVAVALLMLLQVRLALSLSFWQALLLPSLLGGLLGVAFYVHRSGFSPTRSVADAFPFPASVETGAPTSILGKRSTLFILLMTTLGGCLLLCLLSVIQKVLNGIPIRLKGFIIPVPIGSAGGFLFGLYLIKVKRFQAFQDAAFGVLCNEKNRLEHIIRAIRDGIIVTDRHARIVLANPAARQILGKDTGDLQARELWPELQAITCSYRGEEFARPDHQTPFTIRVRRTDKVLRGLEVPLRNDEGVETGSVLVLQDVSEEKKIERLKSEFISTATHELNTPVSVLVGYAELLSSGALDAEQQKAFIQTISEKAWQISNLFDDLLNLDRIGSSQPIELSAGKHRVADILEEVESCLHKARKTHDIDVGFDEGKGLLLNVDLNRLRRVFTHLIDNAVKFSREGSRISLRGGVTGNRYTFTIEDRGVGIPKEERERIFDVFYKSDASNTALAGIGLGLSVAKSLIEAHGGEVGIDSQPERGTIVSFSLPFERHA